MLALIFLAAPMHSEPLFDHYLNALVVNLDNDLPIKLPTSIDLSPIRKKKPDRLPFIDCFHCDTGPFANLEPLSLSLGNDLAVSLSNVFAFDNFPRSIVELWNAASPKPRFD